MPTAAVIETERLRLRPWSLERADLRAAHAIYGDPAVVRTIGGQVMADRDATRAHLEMRLARRRRWGERFGAWAVERRDTGEVVGTGLLKPLPDAEGRDGDDVEVGWHLARAAWGQGIATEAGAGLIAHARDELGLARLHVVAEPGNARSLGVARRLGFIPRGRTRRYYGGLELEHFVQALLPTRATVFTTERLRVREWTTAETDVQAALRIYGDPEVARFVGGVVTAPPAIYAERMLARAERYARWRGRYGVWAAVRREDAVVLGTALLKPLPDPSGALTDDFEMGWHLGRAAWGQGYATEMGRGLLAHARRLGELTAVHAVVDPPNLRSLEVCRRLGLAHLGVTRAYYEGEPLEHFVARLEGPA